MIFFFLISNKERRLKQKEKILFTKKGAKKHRKRITRGESLNPRPIKKGNH